MRKLKMNLKRLKYLLLINFMFLCLNSSYSQKAIGPNDFDQPSFSFDGITDIEIDSKGDKWLLITEMDNIYLKKYINGSWVIMANLLSKYVNINDFDFEIDKDDNKWLVYTELINVNVTNINVLKLVNNTWQLQGNANFSDGIASSPSIALNSKGEPYVAFKDNNNNKSITVVGLVNGIWTPLGNKGFTNLKFFKLIL
jgi:hypothetical protein